MTIEWIVTNGAAYVLGWYAGLYVMRRFRRA